MPILAESPPIQFGNNNPSTPNTSTRKPSTPKPPSQRPAKTPKPPTTRPASFAARHQEFVDRVEEIGTCFEHKDIPDFSETEFQEHSQVAIQDKFLTQDKDRFCSRIAVENLIEALKRTINEKD